MGNKILKVGAVFAGIIHAAPTVSTTDYTIYPIMIGKESRSEQMSEVTTFEIDKQKKALG